MSISIPDPRAHTKTTGCLRDVVAMSAEPGSPHILRLHFNRDVTIADRECLVSLHNAATETRRGAGPIPTYECDLSIGQPVRVMEARDGEDPDKVWFVTGIQWRHQRGRTDFGWDITLASKEDIERGYGATDGFRPEDLVAASHVPERFEDRIAASAHENTAPSP